MQVIKVLTVDVILKFLTCHEENTPAEEWRYMDK